MSTKTASSRTTPPTTGFGGTGTANRARQSSRVAVSESSDGAVWQEKLVVCEGASGDQPVIMVRSYYRNLETSEKVWDEPPSGAAAVVHATPEERGAAEEQRTQLELTLQSIPADTEYLLGQQQHHHGRRDNNDHHHPHDTSIGTGANKKKGFFGRFRKGGAGTGTFSSSSRRHGDRVDIAKDVNLQKAIAQSIRETRGGVDDVELAMALSLSVADTKNQDLDNYHNDVHDGDDKYADDDTNVAIALSTASPPRFEDLEPTEEELFQRALERSQRETSAKRPPVTDDEEDDDEDLRHVLEQSKNEVARAPPVASLPKNYGDYRDESSSCFDGLPPVPENLSEDELELKMPAKPKGMPKFDPYGK